MLDLNITNVSRVVSKTGNPSVRFKVSFLEPDQQFPVIEIDGFLYTTKRNVMAPKGPGLKQYITVRPDVLESLKKFFDASPDAQLALGPYEEDRSNRVMLQIGGRVE